MAKENNFTKAVKELLGDKESLETAQPEAAKDSVVYERSQAAPPQVPPPAPREYSTTPPIKPTPTTGAQETYINKDTVITGSIVSKTSITNEGQVTGDIATQEDVRVTGKVDGNIDGKSISVLGGYVVGNLSAKSEIVNDFASIIVGDIVGENFTSDGKVKGNLKISNAVELKSNAVIVGNVTSRKLTVEEGAVIKGNVQILSPKAAENDVFAIPKSSAAAAEDEMFTIPKHPASKLMEDNEFSVPQYRNLAPTPTPPPAPSPAESPADSFSPTSFPAATAPAASAPAPMPFAAAAPSANKQENLFEALKQRLDQPNSNTDNKE